MITITDNALAKLHELNKDNQTLRIAIIGSGCSGLSYKLSWIPHSEPGDMVVPFDKLYVAIDPKSKLFLSGVQVDYSDGLEGVGFSYSNPASRRVCGCGTSFSV